MYLSVHNRIKLDDARYELSRDAWIPEAWIIEKERQKRKRKDEERRPCLQLPVPELEPMPSKEEEEAMARTVIIIDL